MQIAIATCADKATLIDGDRLLLKELSSFGAQASPVLWNDPHFFDQKWDAIIIRSTWDYYKHVKHFFAWLEKANRLSIKIFNDFSVINWNREKGYLLELKRQGVRCVPSKIFGQVVPVKNIIAEINKIGWSTLIIKPTISASAFLTFKCNLRDHQLAGQLEKIRHHSAVLVQPFFQSVELDGEVSLVFFKDQEEIKYSHGIHKIPKSGDYRVQSEFGGKIALFAATAPLIDFARSSLRFVPSNWTFARVDILDWRLNPFIGEIELIEPDLFLEFHPEAPKALAQAILNKIGPQGRIH